MARPCDAAADDDDVVGVLELRARAPHAALAEDVKHATAPRPATSRLRARRRRRAGRRDGAAASDDGLPHVLAVARRRTAAGSGPRPRDRTQPGVRATEPGRNARTGRDLRAQVERAEAGERLARQRAGDVAAAHERRVGDVRARRASPRRSRRPGRAVDTSSARVGGQRQPPARPRAGAGVAPSAAEATIARGRRARRAARACRGARRRPSPTVSRHGPRSRSPTRSRPRRSSRRGPRSARRRRARWRSIGLRGEAVARDPRRRDRNSRLTSAAPPLRGRRTASS